MGGDEIDEAGRQPSGFKLPRNLVEFADTRQRTAWIDALPAVVDRVREELELDAVGDPFQPGGQTAWVAPAHSAEFGDVVLKVVARHVEAFDEAKGLREWDGEAAVRVFAAREVDENTTVLLLEPCRPGSVLAAEPEAFQDAVIAGLLPRLWRRPPFIETFRPLAEMCDQWADGCGRWAERQAAHVDRGLVREGIALFRSLPRDPAEEVLLCTDLHAENVLAAEREPWLMIDPKPYVGDRTYDALQHMLNCDRLMLDPRALVTAVAAQLNLDAERLLRWLFARCVVGAVDWPELFAVAQQIAPL